MASIRTIRKEANNMTPKHFKAILAKNDIAREIAQARKYNESISYNFVLSCLEDIEAYIGKGNQPSARNIVDTNIHPSSTTI
jgi:hypothetical protein